MCKIFVGTPESDYDAQTVIYFANKITNFRTISNQTRSNTDWQNFARKYQRGRTDDIIEAESGGKGAKEYLEDFSKEIAKQRNPQLKDKDLKKNKYIEQQSPEIAQYIEINKTTIKRNPSLEEFDQYLCKASNLNP